MRTILTPLLGLGLGLALAIAPAACGGKKTDTGAGSATVVAPSAGSAGSAASTGSGSATATASSGSGSAGSAASAGSATAMAGSGSAADAGSGAGSSSDSPMTHRAGMCPSTVLGSTTKDELKGGKIIVTITATDKLAIEAIQKRAAELLKEKADNATPGSTTSGHDQKGTHGGGMGLCPVFVPEGASATAKNEAKGVIVTITPGPKDKPDEFKAIVDARIGKAAEWVKDNIKAGKLGEGGVGGGSGDDGMNRSGKGDGKGAERKALGGSGAKK